MQFEGYVEPQFAAVAQQFVEIMQQPHQRGAALCVQLDGQTVVDIWAGHSDRAATKPWQRDTLVNVFSCGKPLLAVLALQLVGQGVLELDVPVANYWAEFAANGKQEVLVRHLLNHQAGLPAITKTLPPEALYDWQQMIAALIEQQPWWQPGSAHGYMPLTYGWLLGELLQRVTGEPVAQLIQQRICQPLGLELYCGVPEQLHGQISDTSRIKNAVGDEAAMRLLQALMQPEGMVGKAFANPPSILNSSNKLEWRNLCQPAATLHTSASALAGFYTAMLNGSLLQQELLQQMCSEQSYGMDKTLLTTTRLGLGCMLDQPDNPSASFGLGANAFGHSGAGGSLGCADPDTGLSMAFVTNSLGLYVLTDPRARSLNQAIMACL